MPSTNLKNQLMTRKVIIAGTETNRPAMNLRLTVERIEIAMYFYNKSSAIIIAICLLADLLGNFVGYVKIGVDILDIVMIFQRIHQPYHLFRRLFIENHIILGQHRYFR